MESATMYSQNEKLVYLALKMYYPNLAYNEDAEQEARCGLWKACCEYDESRGAFSTFAMQVIRTTVATWLKNENRYRMLQTVSFDDPIVVSSDAVNDTVIGDTIETAPTGEYEIVELESSLLPLLTKRQRTIYNMLKCGASQADIAELIGLSRQCVSGYVQRIREKAKRCSQ